MLTFSFLLSCLIMASFFLSLCLVLINGTHLSQVSSMMSLNSLYAACRDSTLFTFPFYFNNFSEHKCNGSFGFHYSNMNSEWLLTLQSSLQRCSLIAILKQILNIPQEEVNSCFFPVLVSQIGCFNKQSLMVSKDLIWALHPHAKSKQFT